MIQRLTAFIKKLFINQNKYSYNTFKNLEEQRFFELWAFGYSPCKYDISAMHTWNSSHGEKYFIKSSEDIQESVSRMIEIYRSSQ